MKTYSSIHCNDSYLDLISKIEPNDFSLLIRDEQNFMIGWSVEKTLQIDSNQADFNSIDDFIKKNKGQYIFGLFSYDLKNSIYTSLSSNNEKIIGEEESTLKIFKHVLICNKGEFLFFSEDKFCKLYSDAVNELHKKDKETNNTPELSAIESKTTYTKKISRLKSKIQRGDLYEVNYCTSFCLEDSLINLQKSFSNIQRNTAAPFAALFKQKSLHVLCGSPERFVKKSGNKLSSYPIKGTSKRSQDKEEDKRLIEKLNSSTKERAENIMIVDLVRNDLSKIATKESVRVDELTKLYSFKSVHQLISTISCKIDPGTMFSDILHSLFPMGSMTGAPKMNAMKYSESTEEFKRGFYSGTLGVIEPNGNFDLNVIIRTLVYDESSRNGKVGVGGAITILSNEDEEYEECFVKLKAIKDSLC